MSVLQLSISSHRDGLQLSSVAGLNISYNWWNWWWNIIVSESFLQLYVSFWVNILDKYVFGILSFSEDNQYLFWILPLYHLKGRTVVCVLFLGLAQARGPKEHPWLMSLAPMNGAIRSQWAHKIITSWEKR